MSQVFRKRSGTSDVGKKYEDYTIAHLSLLLATDDNIKDFHLSADDENFGYFDDIVLEVESVNGDIRKYAIQLKHRNNKKILTKSLLTSARGEFSIQKYLESFSEIRTNDENVGSCKFLIYTNCQMGLKEYEILKLDCGIDIKFSEKDSPEEFWSGNCYKFEIVNVDDETKVADGYEDFFKNFMLLTNQPNATVTEIMIVNKFKEKFHCDSRPAKLFCNFISQWTNREGTKIKINKTFIEEVLVLQLLDPMIEPLSFSTLTGNRNMELLRKAIVALNVTFINKKNLNKINNIWGLFEIDFTIIVRLVNNYQIDELNDKQRSKLMWLYGVSPLIVQESPTTYNAVKMMQRKNFVIVGEKLSEDRLKNCLVFKNLSDLFSVDRVLYNDIINNFYFSVQNKKTITLKAMIDEHKEFSNLITMDELVSMSYEPVFIINKEEDLPEIHIERLLTKSVIKFEYLQNVIATETLIVLSCMKRFEEIKFRLQNANIIEIEDCLKNEEKTNIQLVKTWKIDIYVHQNQCSRDDFNEVCRRNPGKKSYHHFRVVDNGVLEWICTEGEITDLQEYKSDEYCVREEELIGYQNDNNVNVITGEPGMGKSVMMKKLKNNSVSMFLTTLIPVKDHSQYFRRKNDNENDFVDYLLNEANIHPNLTRFETELIKMMKNTGRIIFLWDGMDEISESEFKVATSIIDKLARKGFKHWLTSRNHLQKILEKKFNVCSRTIKPFDRSQQKYYIERRLNQKITNYKEAIMKIENYVALVQYNEILGIPLQIFMLTELFIRDSDKYKNLLNDVFSITDLYEYFVEEKFNVYLEQKAKVSVDSKHSQDILNTLKKNLHKKHEKNALLAILDEESLVQLGLNKIVTDADVDIDVGISTDVTEAGKPIFLHLSYAEFFAAKFFYKKCHEQKSKDFAKKLKTIIFQEKYRNVRFMFDLMMAENSPAHLAVLYKNLDNLKKCTPEEIKSKDKGGRNPLQLICSWGENYSFVLKRNVEENCSSDDEMGTSVMKQQENPNYKKIIMFLQSKCNVTEKDELFEMDSISYADRSLSLVPILLLFVKQHKIDFSKLQNFKDINTIMYCCANMI